MKKTSTNHLFFSTTICCRFQAGIRAYLRHTVTCLAVLYLESVRLGIIWLKIMSMGLAIVIRPTNSSTFFLALKNIKPPHILGDFNVHKNWLRSTKTDSQERTVRLFASMI